jgi:hypothetical protein
MFSGCLPPEIFSSISVKTRASKAFAVFMDASPLEANFDVLAERPISMI